MKALTYIGEADFGYPTYKDENGKLWANIDYKYSDVSGLHSLTGNSLEGEPNIPFRIYNPDELDVLFDGEPDSRERLYRNDYGLLSRLESDCKYFLGYGNRYEGHLWAKNVDAQIAKMREIWAKFPDDLKPEWLTMKQIDEYEKLMKGK